MFSLSNWGVFSCTVNLKLSLVSIGMVKPEMETDTVSGHAGHWTWGTPASRIQIHLLLSLFALFFVFCFGLFLFFGFFWSVDLSSVLAYSPVLAPSFREVSLLGNVHRLANAPHTFNCFSWHLKTFFFPVSAQGFASACKGSCCRNHLPFF